MGRLVQIETGYVDLAVFNIWVFSLSLSVSGLVSRHKAV